MHCECGYTKVLDETFTTITVPLEDLEEKLLSKLLNNIFSLCFYQ